MVKVILTHEVKDFAAWKKAYDEDASNRDNAQMKVLGVYTAIDNPNKVTVIAEFPNPGAVNVFMDNPALKAAMEKGGVMGKPDVKVLNEVQ
jgi:hypothetical protein